MWSEALIDDLRKKLVRNMSPDQIRKEFEERLDMGQKLYVTSDDISSYLFKNNVNITKSVETLIFNRFNRRQHEKRIIFRDFLFELTPRSTI